MNQGVQQDHNDEEDLAHQVQKRFFSDVTQRRSMLVSQMPLTLSLLLVAVLLAFVSPATLEAPAFEVALVLGLGLTAVCVLVPWNRLPRSAFVVIPLLDFLAVALAREATVETFTSLGLLLVFPVIWLAARLGRTGVALSFVASVLVAGLPLLGGPSASAADIARPFLLPAIMTVIGGAVHILASSLAVQDTRLKLKDAELRMAYRESLERQRLLDTMLDIIGVGVQAVDATGKDVLMNQQQRRNRSFASPTGDPSSGEHELNILSSDGTTPVPTEHRPVARATLGQSFSDYVVRMGTLANQRVLSSTARPMKDKDGNFAGSVLAFSDVTDYVNALALKDDFVANISHEFRTPLMSILGYLDIVLDEPKDDPEQHNAYLRIAQSNAEKLLDLVSDLLSVSSDSMGVQPQKMDLKDVIGMCVATAKPRAQNRGVDIINEVSQPLWLTAAPRGSHRSWTTFSPTRPSTPIQGTQ